MYRPPREERLNTLTHGFAILWMLGSAALVIPRVADHPDPWFFWSVVAFHLAAVGVYTGSTLSHYFDGARQRFFRKMDQAFIYLLIVSSYTPISIAFLKTPFWWGVLITMWALGVTGFVSKLFLGHRVQQVSIWVYLGLGWLPILTGMPFHSSLPGMALFWFVFGGIAYTSGTAFLYNDSKVWYFHGIWHLLVLGGTTSHVIMILSCLPPPA